MHPSRLIALVPLVVSLTLSLHARAAGSGVVLLARARTEPAVAVNPADPSSIVVVSNTNYAAPVDGTYPTAFFTSHDGGRSFQLSNAPQMSPYTTGADPNVSAIHNGTTFFSYLGESPSYCSGGRSAVMLTASYDRGSSFRSPTIVDNDPADDKPALAARGGKPGHARVFLTWTRWHNKGSDIWYSFSSNGGRSFSRPQELYASPLDNFGSAPVLGPHRRVYVFWSVFPEAKLTATTPTYIAMRMSTDDGAHFGPLRRVTRTFMSVPRMALPGSLRNLTGPAVALSRTGALYVSWAEATRTHADGSVDANIEISRSTDGGARWGSPRTVNDVSRNDRFMPAISMMPDGSVGVTFYDRRASVWQLGVEAARVSFQHGFTRSRNVRVNGATSPIGDIYYIAPNSTCFSPGRFFGDYIGAASAPDNKLCVVWADTGLQTPNETDVWFARVTLPEILQTRH